MNKTTKKHLIDFNSFDYLVTPGKRSNEKKSKLLRTVNNFFEQISKYIDILRILRKSGQFLSNEFYVTRKMFWMKKIKDTLIARVQRNILSEKISTGV